MPFPIQLRKAVLAAIAAVGLVGLSACAVVPRATVRAMHEFDLSTVAAGDLRLAIQVSQNVPVASAEATLTIAVTIGDADPVTRAYRMTDASTPAELAALASFARPGLTLRVFALDPAAAASLDAYLASLRETAPPGSRRLSIGLSLRGCDSPPGEGPVRFATLIRLGNDEPYLTLTRLQTLHMPLAVAGASSDCI